MACPPWGHSSLDLGRTLRPFFCAFGGPLQFIARRATRLCAGPGVRSYCARHGPCAGGHAICYRAPASCGLRLRGRRAMQNSNALEGPLSHRCRAAWRDPSGGGAIIEQLSMLRQLHRAPCRRDGLPLHQSSPVHGDGAWHSLTLPSKCALSLGASAPTPRHLTSQKWCELFAKVVSSRAPRPAPG